MALTASTSMAAVGGLESEIQRPSFWRSREISRPFSPELLLPWIKKVRRGQRSAPICTLTINRPSSIVGKPKSPGKNAEKVVLAEAPTSINKGWSNAIVDQLRVLATLASDRSEMHHVLSVQRGNWNSLFHTTITMASVSAGVAAALHGAEHAVSLCVVASGMGLGVAALMALVNLFQPSQLAEEQRHAARLFKRLATDIESTLEIDPRLRQEASHYLQQTLTTLHALNIAFPLPLTPIVLEEFPKVVNPLILSDHQVDLAAPQVQASCRSANGWASAIEKDMKRASKLLQRSDIPTSVEMANGVNNLNKILVVASTVMATSGDLCDMLDTMPGMHISVLGAALTVGGFFVQSLSNAVQLGAAFETYKNCAGDYEDLERSIETSLRIPAQQRGNGMLFLEKISLHVGRSPAESPMVPLDQDKSGRQF